MKEIKLYPGAFRIFLLELLIAVSWFVAGYGVAKWGLF